MSAWQQIRDFARQLLSLARQNQENREAIRLVQEDNRDLRRDNAELRREMNDLRLHMAEVTRVAERMVMELQALGSCPRPI
jgi:regulator of replication initiation timing